MTDAKLVKQIIVSKFGGTSMGDANRMLASAEVALQQKSVVVVVSATSGTTNDLIEIGKKAEAGQWDEVQVLMEKIKAKHFKIGQDLNITLEQSSLLEKLFEEMESIGKGVFFLRDCSLKAMDTLMSLGERMSSVLFTRALESVFSKNKNSQIVELLDVRDVLVTDDSYGKARPLTDEIIKNCAKRLRGIDSLKTVYVTQGFVGKSSSGFTTTLGRGGSDYTAAILAEGVNADILEIWTDVAGIATTDPRICKQAKSIAEISFKEASELATFGAKVLHPATLLPAIRKNIPVFVGSSFDPKLGGTWVKREALQQPLVRAMALRRKQTLVTLTTPEMLYAHGFLFKIFKVFNDFKVSIDAITTSEISVSVTLEDSAIQNRTLIAALEEFAEVQVESDACLVSLIGNNINHTPGLAKTIFEAISDINVRMICLGASKHNFCFIVSDAQGEEVIRRLHRQFIESV